jgi:hypothetical protein
MSGMSEMRIRGLDPAVHKAFKKLCIDEGKSGNEKLCEIVREACVKAGLLKK